MGKFEVELHDWYSLLEHNHDLQIISGGYMLKRDEVSEFCDYWLTQRSLVHEKNSKLGVYINFFQCMKELLNITELDDLDEKVAMLDAKLLGLTRSFNQHKGSHKRRR